MKIISKPLGDRPTASTASLPFFAEADAFS
jgi:hypothetical protein